MSAAKHLKGATVKQIRAVTFGPIKRIAVVPKEKRMQNTKSLVRNVDLASGVAVELLTLSKKELTKKVLENLQIYGPSLMEFARAHKNASALLEIIGAAEARLAVAVAVA